MTEDSPEVATGARKALPDEGAIADPGQSQTADIVRAFRNGLRLGVSLIGTWSIAILIRVLLPRYLGPQRFGTFNFAESFAAAYFVLLHLGLDTYIQKEVPVRPRHPSEFFGGVSLLRLGLGVLLLAALLVTLMVTHRSAQVQRLVFLFAVVQLIVSLNASLAALLQASGTVGGLAVVNVVTKLLWGGGVLLGILVHAPLEVLALALVLSESVKAAFLFTTVRRELGLDVRLDVAACTRVLRASLPFYVNGVVLGLCAKLDVTMLEFLTGDDRQVGWYSASANIAGLALLVSPLLGWVVMPLMSRALNRSREDFWAIVRRSMEGVYVITIPIVLLTILGADVWVGVIFGRAFGPAAMSLRALAPLFMLTYLAILLSMALIILGRGWTLTLISVVGLMVNPVLILLFVPVCQRLFGDGGSGVGAALGVAGMEMVVTSLFLYNLGRDALDRRIVAVVLKGLVSCAIVAVLHFAMRPLGSLRLLFDAVAYVAVAVALGVVRPRQVGIVLRAFRTHH